MLCRGSKTYCCYDKASNKVKFSSKGLTERLIEQCSDGPLEKYVKVIDERGNITSTNRVFRTKDYTVPTYDQTKRRLSCFFSFEKMVEDDGINTSSEFVTLVFCQ